MTLLSSGNLKQISLISIILILGWILLRELSYFIPGFLGAITFYIIFREFYTKLVNVYGWKKWLSAIIILLIIVIVVLIPIYAIVQILIPKFQYAFNNTDALVNKATELTQAVSEYIPEASLSQQNIQESISGLLKYVPGVINATLSVFTNTFTALFILYFMFVSNGTMEKATSSFLPMNEEGKTSLWMETRKMVISNAIGIPALIVAQSIVAIIGYLIFGVEQAVVWGVLTGLASIIPVIGTMIIWVPIAVYLLLVGDIGAGIGLLLYCGIIVSNIDNVLRFTILKKIGDVHPLITVFGVIVGLNVFGLMGLIFGPLILSYFFVLIRIYKQEFIQKKSPLIFETSTEQLRDKKDGV